MSERTEVPDDSDMTRASFNDAVRQESIDGYLVLVEDPVILARARYYARETGNPVMLSALERAVESTVLDRILVDTGVDVDQVRALQRSDLDTVTISAEGEEENRFEAALLSTFALAAMLFMSVIINGEGMALAIVEEKSSRLIEVILGAVTATEFMTGKIQGVLGSGLTQLAVSVGVALFALIFVVPTLSLGADLSGVDWAAILGIELLVYFSIFFALGYFLYSVLIATVAAICTSPEELGQAMIAAMLPLIVALVSTFYAIFNPSTVATRVLSLLPPFTPLVMLARVNVLRPPLWEVWLGGPRSVNAANYASTRTASTTRPYIQSDVVEGPYIELTVPLYARRVFARMEGVCPDFEPKGRSGIVTAPALGVPPDADYEASLLDCLSRVWTLRLDGGPSGLQRATNLSQLKFNTKLEDERKPLGLKSDLVLVVKLGVPTAPVSADGLPVDSRSAHAAAMRDCHHGRLERQELTDPSLDLMSASRPGQWVP